MQVYVELALIENFCMDFVLLSSAKFISKNPCRYWRICLGSLAGAIFAVVFPLINFGAVLSVVVKVLSGLFICLLAGRFKNFKFYVKFTGWFLTLTALLGGALIGIFALTGLEYKEGSGFLLSSVPIGIPLFCALLLVLGARRLAKRLQKGEKNSVKLRIFTEQSSAEITGFFDSGNKVYSNGVPVSVIPKDTAEKLVDESRIKEGVIIHTVAGSRTLKIFTADRIEIEIGEKLRVIKKVKIGISPQPINRAVLHCDLLE